MEQLTAKSQTYPSGDVEDGKQLKENGDLTNYEMLLFWILFQDKYSLS